ncbi:hypothetical protein MC885_010683 [Smutsia gigantea]|nr:hypothetical protein MC885_010683 [Smutsia gigantea]
MAKVFSFIVVATTLLMSGESWALENCLQEQARLRAQVNLLQMRVKQQQLKITQLLHEKEVQFLDKGEENIVIDLGGKRQYAGEIRASDPLLSSSPWTLQEPLESYSLLPFRDQKEARATGHDSGNGYRVRMVPGLGARSKEEPDSVDCSEIFNAGYKRSGFYKIKPLQSPTEFSVYCDMSDGGGWTVIQRRSDGSENFNRNWNDYENGFGNFVQKNGEYWLGNKNLHLVTAQGDYTLKIDLADFEKNSRYAQYKNFKVGDEKNSYELNIGEYSGTAGDSLAGNFHPEVQWWASHQRMKFSTWDRDNDNYEGNCAKEDQSGWWFNRSSNLLEMLALHTYYPPTRHSFST